MNKNYNEPTFKVVSVKSDDVITTSITTTFGFNNGFESETSTASQETGEWNMPTINL